ncbi:MAG TPA: hypothetical protein ENK46_04795 [Flavobacteriia bacterium]|jgi:hypothetical protein|nr:hypothetical protein [Flavobacteriia bacterium]
MNLISLLLFLQVEDINEKIKNAPDGRYGIGVVIGSLLPFVIIVAIAYIVYYIMKNRKDIED